MTRKIASNRPPVGVIAKTQNLAACLAQELGISKPVLLSPKTILEGKCRGTHLRTLLVDDSAWPLSEMVQQAVLPCLHWHMGYVRRVGRIDPLKTGNF